MIRVTRLDGSTLVINSDLVVSLERTPDTVVSLLNNHKLVVRETVDEIVDRIVQYRQRLSLCPIIGEHGVSRLVAGSPGVLGEPQGVVPARGPDSQRENADSADVFRRPHHRG